MINYYLSFLKKISADFSKVAFSFLYGFSFSIPYIVQKLLFLDILKANLHEIENC